MRASRLTMAILLALAVWGLVDAATRRPEAFKTAGRQSKPVWLGLLAASAFVAWFLHAFSLFGGAAAVACIVYLGDVRPAVRDLRAGGW